MAKANAAALATNDETPKTKSVRLKHRKQGSFGKFLPVQGEEEKGSDAL